MLRLRSSGSVPKETALLPYQHLSCGSKAACCEGKEEEVHLNDYQSITEARDRIGHFITQVYHQKRPHSALGYLTPIEFQQRTLS